MGFVLGKGSKAELVGVNPALVAIVTRAIQITTQDFTVHDGLRTKEQQAEMVRTGASTTLNSRHLTGHAVDLVPYVNGKLRWEWPLIYPIAEAMRTAAKELQIQLRWDGAWDEILTETTLPPETLVFDYINRRRSQAKKVFIDGPHFELNPHLNP